jgi:lipoprotein NlpI
MQHLNLKGRRVLIVVAFVALPSGGLGQSLDPLLNRAVMSFEAGEIDAAVADFDELARRVPEAAPSLWQRGIALYYARRWEDCRIQFESHRRVNPNDVENAVWHYICVARLTSPEAARQTLLPVGSDPRVPMRQIYELFSGTLEPDLVMASATAGPRSEFYAHLYLGLYFEAWGEAARALEHLTRAAAPEYAGEGGYMHMVARVHLRLSEGPGGREGV